MFCCGLDRDNDFLTAVTRPQNSRPAAKIPTIKVRNPSKSFMIQIV